MSEIWFDTRKEESATNIRSGTERVAVRQNIRGDAAGDGENDERTLLGAAAVLSTMTHPSPCPMDSKLSCLYPASLSTERHYRRAMAHVGAASVLVGVRTSITGAMEKLAPKKKKHKEDSDFNVITFREDVSWYQFGH